MAATLVPWSWRWPSSPLPCRPWPGSPHVPARPPSIAAAAQKAVVAQAKADARHGPRPVQHREQDRPRVAELLQVPGGHHHAHRRRGGLGYALYSTSNDRVESPTSTTGTEADDDISASRCCWPSSWPCSRSGRRRRPRPGTIEGRVADEQGGVLPGVTVTLTGRQGIADDRHRRQRRLPVRRASRRARTKSGPNWRGSRRRARRTSTSACARP